jgi:hypothetical protein
MSRKHNDVVTRYTAALNALRLQQHNNGFIKNLHETAKTYGMSGGFFTFLIHQDVLSKTGTGKNSKFQFTIDLTEPFNETAVSQSIAEWGHFKKQKRQGKTNEQIKTDAPVRFDGNVAPNQVRKFIHEFSAPELLKELKQRGYHGRITPPTREIKF